MATAVSASVPEPDIFHDVFGHVPLHANRVFADFLQRFGRAAAVLSRRGVLPTVRDRPIAGRIVR